MSGVTIQDTNNMPSLLKRLEEVAGKRLEVGIFGDSGSEILMIARVHEFGTQISVTPKMRAYLHHIGIHLRKETTQINIPERSYIRAGFDANLEVIQKDIAKMLPSVILGNLPLSQFHEVIGTRIAGLLQEWMTDLRDPPNAPSTVDNKQSSNPLIDTGRLRQSVTWRVVDI